MLVLAHALAGLLHSCGRCNRHELPKAAAALFSGTTAWAPLAGTTACCSVPALSSIHRGPQPHPWAPEEASCTCESQQRQRQASISGRSGPAALPLPAARALAAQCRGQPAAALWAARPSPQQRPGFGSAVMIDACRSLGTSARMALITTRSLGSQAVVQRSPPEVGDDAATAATTTSYVQVGALHAACYSAGQADDWAFGKRS